MVPIDAPAVVEDDDHELCQASSCCSLQDQDSDSSTANSSMASSNNGIAAVGTPALSGTMKRRTAAKSSYALTSLLHEGAAESSHTGISPNKSSIGLTSLTTAIAADATAMKAMSPRDFADSLHAAMAQEGDNPNFGDSRNLRQALELSLRQARTLRDQCRRANIALDAPQTSTPSPQFLPLNSWVGLPYASLREERPFLYDHMHTHPLGELLTQTLNMPDLTQIHQGWDPNREPAIEHQRRMFAPLLDKNLRRSFQTAYDSFVTSCCLPLLHAAALRGNVFNSSNRQHHTVSNDPVLYRYQVFPTINVVYPNDPEACQPPTCDLNQGKSVGWLHFHVPLTASQGTSALHCERFPGREDWHALRCTQVGLGYCWDGARCLSFVPLNTTGATRVSMDFRVLLVRSSTVRESPYNRPIDYDLVNDDTLCRPHHLQDALTRISGFYKEATVDCVMGATTRGGTGTVEPDARCGFPFA